MLDVMHHNPIVAATIFLFLQQAYFFFLHNLLPGLFQFSQRQNIYFQDVQNTSRKQKKQDTLPEILLM